VARPAEGRYVTYDLAELWNKESRMIIITLECIERRFHVLNSKTR